ncbi:MAG: hypothetical protein NDI60_04290 [Elusimicrobiales bacterium]|nr:hypothetical protein [Elusimicrobiales bacterium]
MNNLLFAAAAALLLACHSFAQDAAESEEEVAAEISAPDTRDQEALPAQGQAATPGGAGIQQGIKFKPATFSPSAGGAKAAARQEEKEASVESLNAPCQPEDLNWNPGKGGPATAVQGQALRAQREDTTTAYRVRASQMGRRGNFGFASDITHVDTFMRLSNKPCEVTLKRDACEVDYGAVTLWYRTGGKPSTRIGDCVLPKAAGKYMGEDYWWLNVHTRGPCGGGRGWWGGVKTQDGECTRAILYENTEPIETASGTPAGGTGQTNNPKPSGTDESKDCWKAPSGRTCCKVMFSPVPAECQRR